MIYKVIIVGGGFSGVITAIELSKRFGGANVLLIEQNDRILKKVLATGNGRCNLTNENLSSDNYHFVKSNNAFDIVKKYNNKSLKDWFLQIGMMTSNDGDKVYPSSFQASSVVDLLRFKLQSQGVVVKCECRCDSIEKIRDQFEVKCGKDKYFSTNLVLCVGGKSSKQHGTDGSSYCLAQNFGHKLTQTYPSLVQLKTNKEDIKGLKGLKQEVLVKAFDDEKFLAQTKGDVLFTEYGVSGNAIFYLSAYLISAKKPKIKIEFLPDKNFDEVYNLLTYKHNNLTYINLEELLTGVINKQVGKNIVKSCGEFTKNDDIPYIISRKIKNFTLDIVGSLSFDYSQVTHGGICLDDIDIGTLESMLCKGLYFTGEVLDVDGDCGGYNLQFAYSSARLVAESIR